MMPRQPSVPNFISWAIDLMAGSSWLDFSSGATLVAADGAFVSHQLVQLFLVKVLYYFADVLRSLASCNQQSILSFHHHQIAYSHGRHKFTRSVHIIAPSIQNEVAGAGNEIVFPRATLGGVMLVQCRPRTQIVPTERSRQTKHVPALFAFRRARFEHGIVHADVFALGIQPSESGGKLARAEGGGNLFEQRRGFRQMLAQGVG